MRGLSLGQEHRSGSSSASTFWCAPRFSSLLQHLPALVVLRILMQVWCAGWISSRTSRANGWRQNAQQQSLQGDAQTCRCSCNWSSRLTTAPPMKQQVLHPLLRDWTIEGCLCCRLIGRPTQPVMLSQHPAQEAERRQRLWWLGWSRASSRGLLRRTKVRQAAILSAAGSSPPTMQPWRSGMTCSYRPAAPQGLCGSCRGQRLED